MLSLGLCKVPGHDWLCALRLYSGSKMEAESVPKILCLVDISTNYFSLHLV